MPTFAEIGEPFPGWESTSAVNLYVTKGTTFGATWYNGDWGMTHVPTGYRVRHHGLDSKGAPIVIDQATFPEMAAAVMYAELKGADDGSLWGVTRRVAAT